MSKTNPIVVLDPGHGPVTNPYPAASGFYEGTQMYKLMLALKPKLEANGITVIVTRKKLTDDPALDVRGKTAGKNNADLFISLHSDAVGSGVSTACGVSAYYSITDSSTNKKLAAKISSAVSSLMNTRDRGALTRIGNGNADYYGVIRNSAASGCKNAFLIEHGFHTNVNDVKWLIDDTKLNQIADVEAKVIVEYFEKDYKPKTTPPSINVTDDTSGSKQITIFKPLEKYVSSANAISGDKSLSVGSLTAGTYYIYKEYNGATNLTKTRGVPGAWVIIGDAAVEEKNNESEITTPVIKEETISIPTKIKVYTNSDDAEVGINFVTDQNGKIIYYDAGKYYVYKKKTADIINISTKIGTPGAWVNLKDIESDESEFNKGDIVVIKSGPTPKFSDGTTVPMIVIAEINGKRETVVLENDNSNILLSDIDKKIPSMYLDVFAKATDKSIAKADSYLSSSIDNITKDDIAKVLKSSFGALSILANSDAYKNFAKYMESIIDDDTDIDPETGIDFILGKSILTASQLTTYIRKYNPKFDATIARAFIDIGKIYGIRGDVACCQSILETGWFKYVGSSVSPSQNNYCGLGATGNGVAGCSFESVEAGVEAQLQHLYAYACTAVIPAGRKLYDPRFSYVTRGCAPRWVDLNMKWCTGADYGEKILSIFKKACAN